MTPRDVMQQALDALVDLWNDHLDEFDDQTDRAIQALRSELAKPAAVPDALTYSQGTRDYVDGWNDCREAMLSAAPQPPAPAVSPVDVEAVRATISRMKDNHKLRESRGKPDPLISIWANELARAIGDEK